MSAIITNTITATLFALSLFIYFVYAFIHWLKQDRRFPDVIMIFFFSIFFFISLSAWAHYSCWSRLFTCHNEVWLAISLGIVFVNYTIAYAMKMPNILRILVVLISLTLLWFEVTLQRYYYDAFSFLLISIIAVIFSKGLTRIGFLGIFITNLLWVVIRIIIDFHLHGRIQPQLRYDNDVYHLLEIIFTFIIFKSVLKGDWQHPRSLN